MGWFYPKISIVPPPHPETFHREIFGNLSGKTRKKGKKVGNVEKWEKRRMKIGKNLKGRKKMRNAG